MKKTILITGATDGIGFETAKMLVEAGHTVLIHGRSPDKLKATEQALKDISGADAISTYRTDLSRFAEVIGLAEAVSLQHSTLDVLINNAGVYNTASPMTDDGLDSRFVVNTLAPYLLTRKLLPLLGSSSRVVNVSSAAQAPVDLNALKGGVPLSDNAAYAQSKLAITMWTRHLATHLRTDGPKIVAVNPASLLGSKMVKEAYGMEGGDLRIGADILSRAALSDEFSNASGKYFDNDRGQFADPHPDALSDAKCTALVEVMDTLLAPYQ